MAKRFILAALLLLTIAGCAGYRTETDNNPAFSDHYFRRHDVEIDWRSEQVDGAIRLSGRVTNLRYYFLQYMELSARLVDQQGRVLARDNYSDFPNLIPPGKSESFRMEFRIPPGVQAKGIHFSYYYWLAQPPPSYRNYDDSPRFGGFVSAP